MKESAVLREGRNCWRIRRCSRAAFLIDGEAYFSTLARMLTKAKKSIYIIGWDVDSRIRLLREERIGGKQDGLPQELGPLLHALAEREGGPRIRILDWDFSMLYALDREPLPVFKFGWGDDNRMRFHLDDSHPFGASQHQKLVILDERIAFCGGLDLASERWDTPEHAPDDERRKDNGDSYKPFHDVQMMVEGEVAASLAEVARERWRRATGEELPAAKETEELWPEDLEPDLRDVEVAVMRTEPAYEGRDQICEVRDFYLDAIAAAKKTIYLENQYFTSHAVGDALLARLREEDGPEILLVLPRSSSGWLEESTMGVLRARLLQRLFDADHAGRLKACFPWVGKKKVDIHVHAKVLVADGRLVRVGSSNLNNRSMGLDSECDLAVEVPEGSQGCAAVAGFRNRLLAEHLGCSEKKLADAVKKEGLLAAVDALRGKKRGLDPLKPVVERWLDELVPDDASLVDPEKPVSFDDLVEQMSARMKKMNAETKIGRKGRLFALVLAFFLLMAALWRWTPLGELLSPGVLAELGMRFRESPLAPLVSMAVFVVGGLILVPVTLLILVAGLVFGPWWGFAHALSGAMLSAMVTYALGWVLGRNRVRSLAGTWVNRVSRQISDRGLLAMAALRMVPVAPFSVVNLVAGASHIRTLDFFLGTLAGMAPGTLAIVVFQDGLVQLLAKADLSGALTALGLAAVILAGLWWARRRLKRTARGEKGSEDE